MADPNTLRDILQGYNSFQAQLGLTPGAAGGHGPTMMQAPPIRHPGEVSIEATTRMSQQMQAGIQAAQQIRMIPPMNAMAFMPPGGPGGGTPASNAFAAQYQQSAQQIASRYQDPFRAQQMAQQMGQPGFTMMPSPTMMTAPSMGVFRPGFDPAPPMMSARTPPMIQTPFTPQLPRPMFQTGAQLMHSQNQAGATDMFAGTMAAIPTAARGLTGMMGAGIGAMVGHRFGGGIGALGGLLAGGMAGFGPIGGGMESLANQAISPAIERRAFGLQMQNISRNFAVTGSDLDLGGRGLSTSAAISTTNMMRRSVDKGQTSGFNMRDMMGITSSAGDMGMMDMAQNSEQIVTQAKNIARGLSAFMRLANEPDVRRAMQQMAQMRSMGLTIPESTASMQNAQQFARMAGTTVANLSQSAGMPGAMTFAQQGMTAGLGYNVGMGAGAMARQAVASGAFSVGDLAMAGGTRGVQQQLTEAAASTLGVNFPILSMLTRGKNGQLSIDPDKARRIASGSVSLTEQASMAQGNIEQLGGARVISELSTQMDRLRDQVGKQLGAQGTLLFAISQGKAMQQTLGGGISFGGALRAMGMNSQQARTIEQIAKSPEFWQSQIQQTDRQIGEARQGEAAARQRDQDYTSFSGYAGRAAKSLARPFTQMAEYARGAYDSVSQWFSDRAQSEAAAARGGEYMRTDSRLLAPSKAANREVERYKRSAGFMRDLNRMGTEQGRADRYGGWAGAAGTAWNIGTSVAFPLMSVAGGMLGLGSDAPGQSLAVQAMRAKGGVIGTLAGILPSVANAAAYLGDLTGARSTDDVGEARDAASLAGSLRAGVNMSTATDKRLKGEMESTYQAYRRRFGKGKGPESFAAAKSIMADAISDAMRSNTSVWGDKATGMAEAKKVAIAALVKKGYDPGVVERMVNNHASQGLMASVMKQVEQGADPVVKANLAKIKDAAGFTGLEAAKNAKAYQEKLVQFQEDTETAAGIEDISKAAKTAYKDLALTTGADEMIALQALTLERSGNKEDKERAKKLREGLEASGKDYQALRDAAAARKPLTKDQKTAVLASGRRSAELGTHEDRVGAADFFKDRSRAAIGAGQISRGAAKAASDYGIDAFGGFAAGDATSKGGGTAQEKFVAMAKKIADDQIDNIKNTKLREAVKKARGATGGDVAAAGAEGIAALAALDPVDKKNVLGGKGVGGTKEQREQEKLDQISKLATSFTGDAQVDFARAVPAFATASSEFLKAVGEMNKNNERKSLIDKMFRG